MEMNFGIFSCVAKALKAKLTSTSSHPILSLINDKQFKKITADINAECKNDLQEIQKEFKQKPKLEKKSVVERMDNVKPQQKVLCSGLYSLVMNLF